MDRSRLYTLDGMRGLAAICVVLFHLESFGIHLIGAGYLAVDFFFALSGLVLAISYEEKLLDRRTSLIGFLKSRVIRLYPLYLLGAAVGFVALSAGLTFTTFANSANGGWAGLALTNLLFLPDPFSQFNLYPANPPAWSLMFEILVNVVFAVLFVKLPSRWLLLFWVACFTLCAIKVDHAWVRGYTANLGPWWDQFSEGAVRVSCGFTAGMLLKRLGSWRHRRVRWLSVLAPIMLLVLLFRYPSLLSDLVAIGFIIPAVVFLASWAELPGSLRWMCEGLGDISYPLYATHYPVTFIIDKIAIALAVPRFAEALLILATTIILAAVLVPLDARVRTYLSHLLRLRHTAPAQAA